MRPVLACARPVDPARTLAVVRDVNGRCSLEFPIGRPRLLAGGLDHASGLAWEQDRVWFTAARSGLVRSLFQVDLDGHEQHMHHGLGQPRLQDVGPSQQLLVSNEEQVVGALSRRAGDPFERDISWHELTTSRDISGDGQWQLVEESNFAGRDRYSAWMRSIDGRATQAVGDGVPLVLGLDQRSAILRIPGEPSRLAVLGTQNLQRRLLENDALNPLVPTEYASFFPDGPRFAFAASDARGGARIGLQP